MMKMKKYLPILVFALLTFTAFGASAAGTDPSGSGVHTTIPNPFHNAGDTLPALFAAIIDKILLPIGAMVAVISFILAGFKFVTAQGNETKIKEARSALLHTAIGTVLLLGAWTIAKVIETTIKALQ